MAGMSPKEVHTDTHTQTHGCWPGGTQKRMEYEVRALTMHIAWLILIKE